MNRNQQENRPAPGGGKSKNPRDVQSQVERQARHEREPQASGTGGGEDRLRQQANADARVPRSEQASARFDDARPGGNPARESEGGDQHPKRDLPGTD